MEKLKKQTKQFRNEWKYRVQETDLAVIENRLAAVMELDSHSGQNGNYTIHSLYFDDYQESCANETEVGVWYRYKYRIRYYGYDPGFLRLERKEKINGRCHKDSVLISDDIYNRIMEGRPEEIYWQTNNAMLKRFCVNMMTRFFSPRVIIDYERTAYVEQITNVRVTLDKNISVSDSTGDFLSGDYLRYPIQQKSEHVLEVKFDNILPGYIKNIITNKCLRQLSFSKYYLGRLRLRETNNMDRAHGGYWR